jgi:SAM-dependent methyltransferase
VAPEDDMAHRSWDKNLTAYFGAGQATLEIILHGLFLCGSLKVDTILSMPSGYGRELRHIKTAFPQAKIVACDLYKGQVDFCAQEFGAEGIRSKENFDEIEFDKKFDLIWVGSLLTHMPEPLFSRALALFSRSLAPDGVALVTFQGRHAPYIQKNLWKFMPDDKFAVAEAQYRRSGFGYADYGLQDVFNAQKDYGISLSAPSYVAKALEQDDTIQIHGLMERRWDNCQDVVVFKKRNIHA